MKIFYMIYPYIYIQLQGLFCSPCIDIRNYELYTSPAYTPASRISQQTSNTTPMPSMTNACTLFY